MAAFNIVNISEGHAQITYCTLNDLKEKIYYCIQNYHGDKCRLMRCSQPFKDGWETFYEPSHEAHIKRQITIELPMGGLKIENLAKKYILNHELLKGEIE